MACDASFRPRVCSQSNTTRGGGYGDCGPCATIEALVIMSCGRFQYPSTWADRSALIRRIRALGGQDLAHVTSGGPSFIDELYLALTRDTPRTIGGVTYRPLGEDFNALGLRKPLRGTDRYVKFGSFNSALKPELQDGKWAILSIDYGPIDWYPSLVEHPSYDAVTNPYAGRPPAYHVITGQWGYRSGHSVVIGNLRTVSGVETVTLVDPLQDGRTSSHGPSGSVVVNTGPVDLPLSVMRTAAGMFANSTGNAQWITVTQPGALATPEPPAGTIDAVMEADLTFNATAVLQISGGATTPDPGYDPQPFIPCEGTE